MEVSLEGIIGCGKTTVLDLLEREGYHVIREDIAEWTELLNLFYADQRRWALTLQTKIFMHFVGRKQDEGKGDVRIWERSPVSNVKVFYDMLCQMSMINPVEQAVFESLVRELSWEPDRILYLKLDPEQAMARVQQRDGKEDKGVTLEYQKALHLKHDKVMGEIGAVALDATQSPEDICGEITRRILEQDWQ
jgi:deoxyadenosine/deoxycytidine kinase